MTIQNEKPELEVRKTQLLKQEEDLKIQLAKLEESLLEVCTYTLLSKSLLLLLFQLLVFFSCHLVIYTFTVYNFIVLILLVGLSS